VDSFYSGSERSLTLEILLITKEQSLERHLESFRETKRLMLLLLRQRKRKYQSQLKNRKKRLQLLKEKLKLPEMKKLSIVFTMLDKQSSLREKR